MKKKIVFIILILLLIVMLFLIPKDVYKKIFGNHSDEVNVFYNDQILVYMCDIDNMLVGVNAQVESIEEDEISQKFDVLVKQTGVFNDNYDTTINMNTKLLGHTLENNVLTLNLSNEFLESEGRITLEQLVWSFCDNEIDELVIKVDDVKINSLNGFYFNKLDKTMGINITCETSFMFEGNVTTIIEYDNSLIKPVTYVYQDINECDFIVSKLFSDLYESNSYDYVINNDLIIIDLSIDTSLKEDVKQSIVETIKYNLNINNIQIQGLNQVLLEINLNEGL